MLPAGLGGNESGTFIVRICFAQSAHRLGHNLIAFFGYAVVYLEIRRRLSSPGSNIDLDLIFGGIIADRHLSLIRR